MKISPTFAAIRALALTTALALSLAVPLAETGRTVKVEHEGVEALLPALPDAGGAFVSLQALAGALGLETARDEAGVFSLSKGERALRFVPDRPGLAECEGSILSLGRDVKAAEGDLLLPAESLPVVLAQLSPRRDRRDFFGASVDVSIVGTGAESLELRLRVPRVARRVETGLDGSGQPVLQVRGQGSVRLPWLHKEIGGDILAALELTQVSDGFDLAIRPGPGYRGLRAQSLGDEVRVTLLGAPVGSASGASARRGTGRALRVVLDPGHGGEEDGAIGPRGVKEKDVALDIARRLSARLRAEGFEVYLTRQGDESLSLDDRAAIANNLRADLFVSIHANASASPRARGAETYILSRDATDDAARTLAALENDAAGAGAQVGSSMQEEGGLPLILWEMAQVEHLADSYDLAETIQNGLNAALGLKNRGVRQAPFRVLIGATCPAVLVETGFMSNPDEEAQLGSAEHRTRLSTVLAEAIVAFRERGVRRGDGYGSTP